MRKSRNRARTQSFVRSSFFLVIPLVACLWAVAAHAAPSAVPILGEIERITLDNPADHYSGGTIVVGGQIVILPRNLLLDLPANRLTLKQLFDQAPAACVANGESGLAKADACNTSGTGGFAILSANRSDFGNVIAGDVFLQKGQESITGTVTFINYDDGYFRLNGQPGVDNAGVIVRLNDPTGRHTVQAGLGCLPGSQNCSPDPRFTLDPNNYTNSFSNGYPYCLPSTVPRTFTNILGDNVTSSAAAADGTGDYLCPDTNRPAGLNLPAADSRRFAPLKVGDTITVEGNFETINGVMFLSAHTSSIGIALPSSATPGQPDYFTLAEVFMDAPAFYNQRYRTLIIGYTTLANPATDVLFWTVHRDKVNNEIHELPWASVLGCDAAGGAGTCSSQGLVGAGANIFRIRHDIDFILAADGPQRFGSAKPKLSPCAHIRNEPRFGNPSPFCPSAASNPKGDDTGSLADEFGIVSPIPHEIMGRTGRKVADVGGTIHSIDVNGNEATWGQYLFPFGVNLGGISLQEFNEIDLNLIHTPYIFEGIPWNLDRRLGPGGCNGPCEADVPGNPYAFALDPFPYSGLHPATALDTLVGLVAGLGGLPTGPYTDNNFTASTLSNVRNRMFSFVDNTLGTFNGDATVLDNTLGAALIPPAFAIVPTPLLIGPVDNVTLTANVASPQFPGTVVTFTASASGGTRLHEYQFLLNVGGAGWSVVQDFSTLASWVWDTKGLRGGDFFIAVNARSLGSTAPSEAYAEIPYSINSVAATGVTLSPSAASPQFPGAHVTFTAAASGGTGPYEYQFLVNVAGGGFNIVQPYSTLPTWTWNIPTSAVGADVIAVQARTVGSVLPAEAYQQVNYIVSPNASTSVTLTPNLASPQAVNTQVIFTAAATGGAGPYEYQFLLNINGSGWVVMQPFSTLPAWTWTIPLSAVGSDFIAVQARTVGSVAGVEAYSQIPYDVPSPTPTSVTLTPSLPSPQTAGADVVFTAAASGGTGPFEYQFLLNVNGNGWNVVQPYSTLSTWTWATNAGSIGSDFVAVQTRSVGSASPAEAYRQADFVIQP